jgi:SPP1 family predicted phage head-tail adaptor
MPVCQKLRSRIRKPCLGDLNTEITLQSRSITPSATVSIDFTETFTGLATVWASIKTVRGKTEFDGANVEREITHEFIARFLSGIDTETWVLFEGIRYDIIKTEDLEERHEFMLLMCSKLGPDTIPVNDA